MLRATSEIAVAISVRSLAVNFSGFASSRAFWRASSTSASARICTTSSAAMVVDPELLQEGETLFEIKSRIDPLEGEAELDHGKGDFRLDAHDDGRGAKQLDHLRDPAQRAGGKRIHDVEHGHVDDDACRAIAPHVCHQLVAHLREIGVGHRPLDRRDQNTSLLEDGRAHAWCPDLASTGCHLAGAGPGHDVAEQLLGTLDAALQVADRKDAAEIDPERHHRLRDLWRDPGDDYACSHEPGGLDRLHDVIGDPGIHG